MGEYKLTRTGMVPLAFSGNLVAQATSKAHQGPLQNRWHDLAVYQTAGGKLVGRIGFGTIWQGEHNRETVVLAETSTDLVRLFAEYDPTSEWEGYPSRPEYAEKQARIQAAVTDGYHHAVSELFADIDECEERIA